jgi:hypothetical protein
MRALILGVLLAVAIGSPAVAQAPPPVFVDFEGQPVGTEDPAIDGARFGSALQCPSQILGSDGNGGGKYFFTCGQAEISLDSAQARVAVFFRVQAATAPTLTALARDRAGRVLDSRTIAGAPVNQWSPLVLRAPAGEPQITRVEATSSEGVLGLDDVGFSPLPQPDTVITGGPADTAASGDATFAFRSNGQPQTGFSCSLDGAAAEPCESPVTYAGLTDGPHTFAVASIDRWGATDETPATRTWTVRKDSNGDGVPDALDANGDGVPDAIDPDGDSVPDARDNCPGTSNPGQGDTDRDRIGNACETLPSGTIPAAAGRRITVRLLFGEVFVKLPPGATGAFTTGLRVPFQDPGFVPLKGVATVPVGSVFDARRGGLAVGAALNAPLKGRAARRRLARLRAGIFAIRQARALRRSRRTIAARAALVSAAGAERPCQGSGPPKGIAVRSLTMTAGRGFRAVGGASRTVALKGRPTVTVTDRCDGTATSVRRGRGRVRVVASRGGRRRVLRGGDRYHVRARLFAARKGRR